MRYVVSLMLFALVAPVAGLAGEVDPACVAKIKSVGPLAWQAAADRMNDVEYTFHNQVKSLDSTHKKPATSLGSDCVVSLSLAEKRWIIDARHVQKGNDGLYVNNEKYKFSVVRKKNDDVNPFQLVEASRRDEPSDQKPSEDKFKVVQDSLGASFSLLGLDLAKMFPNPDYELVAAKFVGQEVTDDRPIRLEWSTPLAVGQKFWVELSPRTSWLIERCGVKTPEGMELLREVAYQPYEQGLVPKTVKTTMKFPQFAQTETLTIEPPHAGTRSVAEFYLPHYGISESVLDVTRTNPRVRLVAIVLSVFGVVASIYFYWLSRRSSGPKVTPA